MPHQKFDRTKLRILSLTERKNQISIKEKMIPLTFRPQNLTEEARRLISLTAEKILISKSKRRPVVLAFGAHSIKNGLGTILQELIKKGWVTHLATNGAGIIHDWEIAYQGYTGESVRENVDNGQFGIWEETGKFINLAITTGAFEKLGYGESVGKMIFNEGLTVPNKESLLKSIRQDIETDPDMASAAADIYNTISKNNLPAGFMPVPHPFREYSVQCAAYDLKVPFTGHPMIGHDIIYNHPMNHGAAIGRTALTDFLYYTASISNIEDGVYLSVGSAVMSPMIFEKALSMGQNIAIQNNSHIDNHYILVVDLAENRWDWKANGEPPADDPAYYLRYCKTFSRMGGEMNYLQADNRDFLTELYHILSELDPQ